jgi:predicted phosphodiesterase
LLDNNISKGVAIRDVVILSSGDLANGEGIYLTQVFEQELAPPKQVMLVVDVISKLIISLLERKLPVTVYGVRGNHGRTGKDTDVASNWDLMIYMILDFWAKFVLKNKNLQIKYTETEHMRLEIRTHGYLLRHICPEQVDSPAGRVKINQWARQYNIEGVVYGHYHHAGISDCDTVRVFRGGSTVGGDSLSDSMSKHSEPIQLVWGVNEARVSTFMYLVDLGETK